MNEQGIKKKSKVVVHVTPRVHPERVAGVERSVYNITASCVLAYSLNLPDHVCLRQCSLGCLIICL
jgi:hypothetical protein